MSLNKTSIDWVKNPDGTQGYTWNPITGCLNGCPYCYARKLANGRLRSRYLLHGELAPRLGGETIHPTFDPFYPRFREDRVRENFGACTSGAEPKGIFVCDMSDLFGVGIPEAWTRRVLSHISMSWYREHRFYLLTKQPQNLVKFSPFPDNCWVGVSITTFDLARKALIALAQIEAKVKFVSYEPLLEQIPCKHILNLIDWVIIGAQTKPYKPPELEFVYEIVQAADKAEIPVFLKNNLDPIIPYSTMFRTEDRKLRQEMPA